MKKIINYIFFSFTFIFISTTFTFSQSGWFLQQSNTHKKLYSVFFSDMNTGYACGSGILLKTSNGGQNWTTLMTVWTFNSLYFINSITGYVAGYSYDGFIIKTTDGGLNWISQNPNTLYHLNSIYFLPGTEGMIGYAAGDYGSMIKTTNGGSYWFLMTSGVSEHLYSIYFPDINTGFCVGEIGRILKTTNCGSYWSNISIYVGYIGFCGVFFINYNTGFLTGGEYTNYPGLVYKTTNSGQNWSTQANAGGSAITFVNNTTGYTVGPQGNICKTTNCGTNWIQQTSTTTEILRSVNFVDANTGWIVGDTGIILKTTNGGGPIGIRPISSEVPKSFQLFQNYPNPFNPSTKIRFTIALSPLSERGAGGFVTIKIFDILGREIEVLVNKSLQPGTYEAEWDASNYPSGVYFYKLQSDNFTETKKMILLK